MFRTVLTTTVGTALVAIVVGGTFAQEAGEKDKKTEKRLTAEVRDGKVIIRDAAGDVKVVDLKSGHGEDLPHAIIAGAPGDQEGVTRKWKAVVVDEDGKRRVIELESDSGESIFIPDGKGRIIVGEDAGNSFEFAVPGVTQGGRILSFGQTAGGKYMIGVNCTEASDELRAHVDLKEGVGLMVQSVVDDTPAAKAGIKVHDVLVRIDGDDLSSTAQLVEAVQNAGKEEKALKIELLRRGSDETVEVRPTARQGLAVEFDELAEDTDPEVRQRLHKALEKMRKDGLGEFRFEHVGPALHVPTIRTRTEKDLEAEIKALQEQVAKLREAIERLKSDK